MMKRYTLSAAMACLLTFAQSQVMAQNTTTPASASKVVYNFAGFNDVALLNFFAELDAAGRKYPTVAEMKEKGIYEELEFVRSHVKKRKIMSREDRLISNTFENRELFMNIPAGSGKTYGGYPSKDFAHDNYSMWNYTNLFGAWNHGLFQVPGSWVDAAHKNGTDMLSGVKFFESWVQGSNSTGWIDFISTKNSDGTFKYARPLINLLRFLGMDGINYNWEAAGYNYDSVVKFHKELYKIAAEEKFDNFHVMIYTQLQGLNTANSNALFGDGSGRTAEVMLNYASGDFSPFIGSSVSKAKEVLGTTEGLYAGVWIVTMNRGWNRLDNGASKECGICLWGEHADSRFWSYNSGADVFEKMSNYQKLLERAFSGGYRSPINRPGISTTGHNWEKNTVNDPEPLNRFPGLATWIPERSAIQGKLPFYTGFNLGNGERYNYKGKKTAGLWYNMSNQDIVPTYRWLVYDAGTTNLSRQIQPDFILEDAYTGGTCLRLAAANGSSSGTDIILYKTKLTPNSGSVYANIAVKDGQEGIRPSQLSLIIKLAGSSDWLEYPFGDIDGKNWVEKKIMLTGVTANSTIERIGFRTGSTSPDFNLYVGKLEINDDVKVTPENIESLTIEVKEETKTSLSVKAMWDLVMKRADGGLVYNDDANIDHFQVLYKNGVGGRVSEVARTSQWAAYVGDIKFESENDDPYIGVRAVGTDLKTYSPIKWVQIPRANQATLPEEDMTAAYGKVELDVAAEGAAIAQEVRYVEQFITEDAIENINYRADGPVGGNNYVNATDQVLKVRQGQTVTLKFKGYETLKRFGNTYDDLRYCMGRGWIDLNGDQRFHPDDLSANENEGECLFFLGSPRAATLDQVKGLVSKTFTVPRDAAPGKSIMRIVFSDAWFPGTLMPIGKFRKGFAIDFGVEIVGDNPARQKPVDTHDQGEAEEPEGMTTQTTDISASTVAHASDVICDGKTFRFNDVEKAWIFSTDGKLMRALNNPQSVTINDIPQGVYLVKMMSGSIIRTKKVAVQ